MLAAALTTAVLTLAYWLVTRAAYLQGYRAGFVDGVSDEKRHRAGGWPAPANDTARTN